MNDIHIQGKQMLKFSRGNAKLQQGEVIFDLPAGHSCPFANNCLSKADKITGKIKDGTNTEFRCYAASSECTYPNVRVARWHNFELVKGKNRQELVQLIQSSLPGGHIYRVHSSGDFFNMEYFKAWMDVAKANPSKIFYAYTKAIPFWVKYKQWIPKNFHLNASLGGTHDYLIAKHNLKSVKVVFSTEEAKKLNLEIDHDDSHAWKSNKSFALLLHGMQPAKTAASAAWQILRYQGAGYNKTITMAKKLSTGSVWYPNVSLVMN